MSYLIDTCCISELAKSNPDENVIQWFSDHNELDLYLSVITFGELRKGIEKLPSSKRKRRLNHWINEDLLHRFKNRALDVSLTEVNQWGKVLAKAEKMGTPLPAIDGLIAATALVHDFAVVTRNTKDMKASGVELINPWKYNANT
ncbi:MAG: type II toxin-antitoxin system VapC family toxin [Fodinibius sp.]|nr:type II toxin-antitoxin system VapC family toxin [Fodinibius sp.]